MKFTYLFVLMLFVLSCGVENHDSLIKEKDLISTRTDAPLLKLETKMQWASFIAARVLEIDPLARDEFSSASLISDGIISLKNIFKPNSVAPNFKAKFLEMVDWYSMIICDLGKPEIGVVPPSSSQNPNCSAEYMDYIYIDNCLEFYFPEGLNLNPILPISSTAHPLTPATSNYGYKRYKKMPDITKVIEVTINPSYLLINNDIIVTRPIDSGECDYSEWGVSDFTLFLND